MKTVSKFRIVLSIVGLLFSVCIYSQTPIYNSYPSATPTVFLDFDGQYLDGTSWNFSGPLSLGPGNMTNDQITEIFNRVAEDYRPFTINITTDSTKYWSAPADRRMRVIFTISSSWYGAAGGVSYIGSFNWGDNTPCFVFTALLGYKTKWIAEAASHEIGHTLGLNHQSSYDLNCVKTTEYNAGTGAGEIAWAPIMGVGYYRNFTLWHNGSNPWGCANYQDDLSIITTNNNGVSYRNDDYSNNVNGGATQANFANNRFSVSGVIETITDKDVFKFTMPIRGSFHLDANPYSIASDDNGSNLDVKIQLLSNGQTVLGTYNPDLLLNATVDTTLNAGTYFLRVEGSGNIYAPDYASLGSYTLSASYAPITALPVHRFELHGTNDNSKHKLNWIIDADETVVQQILEVSSDGKNFQTLAEVNSTARAYLSMAANNDILYYRLNVKFDDGQQYFSNIVALRNTAEKPSVKNSLVRNSVQVNSPSAFTYTIVDFSGRAIVKGNLVQGTNNISTSGIGNGMYIIKYSNGQEQYAEKFMKQ
jgi:hypothetical protein